MTGTTQINYTIEKQKMPKFSITTLGCKVNQAESEAIAQELLDSEWLAASSCENAEVCVVNTCTVTQKASMQSRQAIRRAIRSNPNARVIVTGCYAQTAPQEIKDIEGVDCIVGQDKKHAIGRMIRTNGDINSETEMAFPGDIKLERHFAKMSIATAASRTRPFLKIQDGCNAFCTYCIVPYARGRSRSLPVDDVLRSIDRFAEAGFEEVVLTGIHLGAYGRDLNPATNLADLMKRIETKASITRIRISSIEPFELTEEVIQQVAASEIFCKHFHIPLQSGDDGILKKMGRPYTQQDFTALISNIHKRMPAAAIGVDTLIGFPGETEAAFENTYELIDRLPISYLHVFPFSQRPGTPAATLPNKIDPRIIKARAERIRELGHQKRIDFYRRFEGVSLSVLIEGKRDRATGLLKGLSSNYLPVLVDGGNDLQNIIVDVKIKKLEGDRLYGELGN
jgi:threonylcarbamoyladenosine tRNA methylthiotransferase MtaB